MTNTRPRSREREQPIARAIAAAGGVCALARKLGVSAPTVSRWRRVPASRVAAVAAATGIPAAELRPDLAAAFVTAKAD